MRCPYCGHDNSGNARRCENCGKSLERAKEKRREQRILIYAILLIILIAVGGVAAMFAVSDVINSGTAEIDQPQKVTIVSTPTPTPTEEPAADSSASSEEAESSSASEENAEAEATPEPTEEVTLPTGAVNTTLVGEERSTEVAELGYTMMYPISAEATSYLYQQEVSNSPYVLFDGQYWSSWQDGVDGDGLGENITFTYDKEYQVRFMKIRLGNWYDPDGTGYYYTSNSRPETITFRLGSEAFKVTFPDEKKEFWVELSRDVPASYVNLTIDSVYKGTEWDDTCINEVELYGK